MRESGGRRAWERLAFGAALAALTTLAACGGGEAQASGGEGGRQQGGRGGGGGPTAVEVVAVAPRTVTETREVTGTLAPLREARLLAQLEGAVVRVRAEEGDRVGAGEVLAEFDATVQAAELAAAETRARTARLAAARAGRLLALGAASRGEQEEALAALREAEGQLSAARARLAYGRVRSPFEGVVTAVRVDPGDVVGARQEVAVVSDVRALRAEVPVSELDLVRLREGAPVRATVDALPGRTLAARIRRVYPTVDPTSRQGVVEVELPQVAGPRAAPALVPGLLARLTFTVDEAPNALAVPLDAVRRDVRDRPYVYVVQDVFVREPAGGEKGGQKGDDGEAEGGESKGERGGGDGGGGEKGDSTVVRRAQIVLRRPVEVGLRGGDNWVQLVRGVRPGDRVVVSGDQELSDSARVRVLPQRRGGGAAGAPAGTRSADAGAGGASPGGAAGAAGAPADGGATGALGAGDADGGSGTGAAGAGRAGAVGTVGAGSASSAATGAATGAAAGRGSAAGAGSPAGTGTAGRAGGTSGTGRAGSAAGTGTGRAGGAASSGAGTTGGPGGG